MQGQNHKKRNHFPDWLFYTLTALFLTATSLSVIFFQRSQKIHESLIENIDSLNTSRIKVNKIDSLLGNQGKFEIKNMGTKAFTIRDLFVCYFDTTLNKFQTVRGMVNETLETNESCSPVFYNGMNTIWDGTALCYFLTVQPGYIMTREGDLYYSGQLHKGKTINLSIDYRNDNSGFVTMTCK